MATGTTTTANLIVPDVWADAVGPTILGKSVMVALADVDDQLVGQPGDSVTFPKWNYIGDADDLTEAVAMDTTQMSMTDSKATIKEAGKAVELSDNATLNALGNPNAQARVQLALAVARKIDKDLRAAAEYEHVNGGAGDEEASTAPLKFTTAGRLSWNALTQAFALWGDEYDPSEVAGIVIHSAQSQQLMNDPNFIDSTKFGQGAVLLRGQIGSIGTIPVIVSDRATTVADVDAGTAGNQAGVKALLIRKGALALKYKRRPIVETDRDILKRTNIVTTNVHYATKRVDDRGVIVLTTSSALVTE
jgi:N4-gp56 family major capsid protein